MKIELYVTFWMDRKSENVLITEADLVDLVQHKMAMMGITCHVKAIEIVPEPVADALVMALRLLGEDDDTFSPECREAMSRWRPIAMRVLSSASQQEDAAPCVKNV